MKQLKAAEEHYKSRAPAKGQPHPDHNKKATLMAALLNWTATQDYTQLYETTKEEAERINSVLTALRKPTLTDQLNALKTILPFYKTPLQMEREVGTCSFFSAKKDPSKLVLSFSLLPQSPLTEITALVCFALGAAGAERAPGAPPKGSLVQVTLDRYAKRSVPEQTETLLAADRSVGVRAAVPSHHARGADEEETALNQLSS